MAKFSLIKEYNGIIFIAYKATLYTIRGNNVTECLKLQDDEDIHKHATLSESDGFLYCACDEHVYRLKLNESSWEV